MYTLVKMKFGSELYGTKTPASDEDYIGIFVPSADDILLQQVQESIRTSTKLDEKTKNVAGDIDTQMFSLQRYLGLLLAGETAAVEMLFIPKELYVEHNKPFVFDPWGHILAYKNSLISKSIKSYVGYAKMQANKYGLKGSRIAASRELLEFLDAFPENAKLSTYKDSLEVLIEKSKLSTIEEKPILAFEEITTTNNCKDMCINVGTKKILLSVKVKQAKAILKKMLDGYGTRALEAAENRGVDHKAMSHAVRVCDEAEELLRTGNITFPRPNAKFLLDIKLGKIPYKETSLMIEAGITRLETASAASKLLETPVRTLADELVKHVYALEVVKKNVEQGFGSFGG